MTDGEPQLKFEEGFIVDCRALDEFVAIHLEGYGVSWRALDTDSDGYHNGSYQKAEVAPGRESDWDDGEDFNSWLRGDQYYPDEEEGFLYNAIPGVQEMLQWLCDLGKVPAGKYLVELWW